MAAGVELVNGPSIEATVSLKYPSSLSSLLPNSSDCEACRPCWHHPGHAPQDCPGASTVLGRPQLPGTTPQPLLNMHTLPSSQALAIRQVTQGQRQNPGRGAVIAPAKLWGAGSCCLVPPRRALRTSSSPQGLCLYLAKPGKVGGAPELGLRWTVT